MIVILNPNAGKGKGKRFISIVEKALRGQGLTFDIVETTGPGHATELVRAAVEKGEKTVIAAGGDGTIREVVNGVAGTEATMGIMPVGSGNDFIKSVAIPLDLEAAARVIRAGFVRHIDLPRMGSLCFANAAGIGFDALVAIEANRMRWLRGLPLYLGSVLKATLNFSCPRTVIELDDRRLEQSILLVAAGNGQYYGGGFHITPEAKPDDGLLDICVIDAVTGLRIIRCLSYVIKGTHAQLPEVKFYRTRRMRITSPDVLYVQADGDLVTTADPHEVVIEVLPGGLHLLVQNPGHSS